MVTGQGVVSSLGHNPDEFYMNLLAGKSGISMIDGWDTGGACCRADWVLLSRVTSWCHSRGSVQACRASSAMVLHV